VWSFVKCLECKRERERCAVSALSMLEKEGEGARGGCGALSLLDIYIYIYMYTAREREMCCKCSKYVREREREREEGVVICKVRSVAMCTFPRESRDFAGVAVLFASRYIYMYTHMYITHVYLHT